MTLKGWDKAAIGTTPQGDRQLHFERLLPEDIEPIPNGYSPPNSRYCISAAITSNYLTPEEMIEIAEAFR